MLRFNYRVARRPRQQRCYDIALVSKLRELSILRYHLQYGDYITDQHEDFRDKAATLQSQHQRFFSKKLPETEVQALIEKEKKELLECVSMGKRV